ncbi:MAG: PEP-CTERM sorting domain-containing protein [Kiritimatiellae bacterium]|nr:PEP-CTERM sorting domain-containing protein [Kiritimatiellia bacterium]
MKKLMILTAVALSAIAVNAAAVTWGTGTVYQPTDGTKKAGSKGAGYAFTITKAQYDTWFAMSVADGMKDVYDTFGGSTTSADFVMSNGAATPKNQFKIGEGTFTTEVGANSTQYLAFVFTYTDGEDQWYMANVSSFAMGEMPVDDTKNNVATIWGGTASTGGTANMSWTAVPEPTSGLLLLLGVAGLALKRKRA